MSGAHIDKKIFSFFIAPFIMAFMPFTFLFVCMRISYAFVDQTIYDIMRKR